MEFRVFTQDPTPDYTNPVTLDLQALGFHPGQQAKVTEMWGGNDMGTFKDSEFKPVLKAHESGLYRLTRLDRSGDASVSLSIPAGEHPADEAFEMTVTIAGVPASAPAAASDDQSAADRSYIQLLCDGVVIGTLDASAGSAPYLCSGLAQGNHTFRAPYSGTATIASATSDEVGVTISEPAGIESVTASPIPGIDVTPGHGIVTVTADHAVSTPVYTIGGALKAIIEAKPGASVTLPLPIGLYLIANRTICIK